MISFIIYTCVFTEMIGRATSIVPFSVSTLHVWRYKHRTEYWLTATAPLLQLASYNLSEIKVEK